MYVCVRVCVMRVCVCVHTHKHTLHTPQAVCGYRLVNVYSESDWVLAFLYRSSSFSRYVAGLCVCVCARATCVLCTYSMYT